MHSGEWTKYYHYPDAGISLVYSNLGNEKVFGNEVDLCPFITFYAGKTLKKAWLFRFGMGTSHFSTHYNVLHNPQDAPIGSEYTWNFEGFLYRNLIITKNFSLRGGAGYFHSSNGHTQLPNLGLNSGVLSLCAQFYTKNINPDFVIPERKKEKVPYRYFITLRQGIGIHKLGSPFGPANSPTSEVYSSAVSGGIIFNDHIKVRSGFTYRLYDHFLDDSPFTKKGTPWYYSNIYFFAGCEFLMGHVSIDIEGGINLYKPFYPTFYREYGGSTATAQYFLKKTFPCRLGLNYYLINTSKHPIFNVFIGADLNANFGEADFSEISVGVCYNLRGRK
jgi:hypothetical protein